MTPKPGSRLELFLVDRRRNARRFYALSIVSLPPGVVLVVERGRIGSRPVVERKRFPDLAALRKKWKSLEALRRRHGYEERGETRQLELWPESSMSSPGEEILSR